MSKQAYFRVGVITSPHGVHGEVNVFPTTDEPRRFSELETVLLDLPGGYQEREVEHVKYHKNMVILKLSGISNMDEAGRYRKCDLLVTREQALPLAENEYYIADLIGLTVRSDEGEVLGTIRDVMQTAANDVYVVRGGEYGEILIPVIPPCEIHVDLDAEVVTVHLLPGLLDLK